MSAPGGPRPPEGDGGPRRTPRKGARAPGPVLTSSSRRRCSFCSSMRFWRSASSCRLCSSFSRCCCSSCCRRRASDRSLLASWSLRKSRRSVDSPGRLRMELRAGRETGQGPLRVGSSLPWGPRGGGEPSTGSLSLHQFHCSPRQRNRVQGTNSGPASPSV